MTISNHKSTEATIRNLEMHVGQLAKKMEDNAKKQFGANTKVNPKEECKAFANIDDERVKESKERVELEKREYRREKIDKERQYERFKEIFRKLEITIPLTKALQQFPAYAKHMKQFLTKKRYLDEETMDEQGGCGVILEKPFPPKVKDPGSYAIPCVIGKVNIRKALIDLGSSINLMLLSLLERIGDLEVKPTKVTLLMADGSSKKPYGIAEDVV
ncbi:uncharacterized protein LOC124845304, partial [Vigna umbellata]|uniref:uncharacterized protein LOC124845304 n=1 Tax=Vigna umbellata TaxID=87088 RepID=UPI001F5EF719